ncbi:MAG: disulfide bond formation protein B [Alphaproteobacteria bacterium]|nr:disulfide bond formation protein B [Alphaproteobacteria bacterium]
MRTSPNTIPGFILLVTVAILSSAYSAQYIGGLRPCILCLYERVPWIVTGALMLVTILMQFSGPARRGILLFAGLLMLAGAALGGYHVGVEQEIFQPPTTCSATSTPSTLNELKALLETTMPPRCDEISWELFGISLAGYNAIASLVVGLVALFGRKSR